MHTSPLSPSPLLALVCLGIVHRLRPGWVALPLRRAAEAEGVRAERLSRLVTGLLPCFEHTLEERTRIGRPSRQRDEDALAERCAVQSALLDVAGALCAHLPWRRAAVRGLVLGAWMRLCAEHPALTKERFCEALALSPRTLRHWLAHAPAQPSPAPPTPPAEPARRRRAPRIRRPRFTPDVVLPDTQHGADTTKLRAFGVELSLVGVQDVGERHEDLFDVVLVEPREDAELVSKAIASALAELPGAQLLTDQGTPYMAERTLEELARLEVEHAPNVEGDPRGKATVERAFGSLKTILASLLTITNDLARSVPALATPELATATVRVLATAMLRAYQAGARATKRMLDARGAIDVDALARAAAKQREDARAAERSSRLILARIHATYGIDGAPRSFVDALRRYRPDVLLDAEKRFAAQLARQEVRSPRAYFATIAERVDEEHRAERAKRAAARRDAQRHEREQREHHARLDAWNADPVAWLHDALSAFSDAWLPATRTLLFEGVGAPTAWLDCAARRLVELHDRDATDLATAALHDWAGRHLDSLGPQRIDAVLAAARPRLERILPTRPPPPDCASDFVSAMLASTGKPRRPAPSQPLRT